MAPVTELTAEDFQFALSPGLYHAGPSRPSDLTIENFDLSPYSSLYPPYVLSTNHAAALHFGAILPG
jgi:hypothetical protein